VGNWFITDEEPPRWEFIGERQSEQLPDLPAQARKPQSPKSGDPRPDTFPRDTNPFQMHNRTGNPPPRDRAGHQSSRERPDRPPSRRHDEPKDIHLENVRPSPRLNQPGQLHQRRQAPDPNDPNDPNDSSDDDGGRGPPRGPRGPPRRSASQYTGTPAPVVDQRIQKLSSKTMGTFNPDQDSVNQFCESLLTLVEMYGEISVIAAIPAALDGRAKLWF